MSSNHSRNPSEETNASSMSYILEHVLQYPGSYEIPLRTMYTLNCAPRAQPLPKDRSRSPTPSANERSASPVSGQVAWNDAESATMNFTSQLMSHMNSMPTHPSALPPTFIVNFVSRCFHPTLSLVDFPQALTALDYLRDLDNRRRKEMIAAFERVHVHAESFESDIDAIADRFPGIALWVQNVQGKNKRAEAYYAQLWLGLRRWIMINELSLQPFNKLNCMGMLNTLLPPMPPNGGGKLPPHITHQKLREERQAFFDYIGMVQKNGPSILRPVIEMNRGPEDDNGWASVQKTVDKYLRVAKHMIDDCIATTAEKFEQAEENRKGKKTDSGVSFGSTERRPSTTSTTKKDKPLPDVAAESASAPKGMSTLERITREFKRMRVKARPDVEEIVKHDQSSAANYVPMTGENKGKKIKKARSLANLGGLRGANGSSTSLAGSRKGSEVAPFDAEEMKRHRMLYEASQAKDSKVAA